jgi:hypothetical protein
MHWYHTCQAAWQPLLRKSDKGVQTWGGALLPQLGAFFAKLVESLPVGVVRVSVIPGFNRQHFQE